MKKLSVTFEGAADPTGYLFSFAKLAELYKKSHEALISAFGLISAAKTDAGAKDRMISLVAEASGAEAAALAIMES